MRVVTYDDRESERGQYRSPFRPFPIRMADGSEIRVSHPNAIARDEESRTAVCLTGRGAWSVIDVDRVTSLGDAPASPSPET